MGSTNKLPLHFKEKVLAFPEHRMGVHRVALVLEDGSQVLDVLVAWGDEVVKVGGMDSVAELPLAEVVDVVDMSGP